MASTDSRPIPLKNSGYRVRFPIFDADGDLVTGAAGLDSEISKDDGTFVDCTNEATEIATASGIYYLDLTSTEMNADGVTIIVKTSTTGAKTTPIMLYPQETGDIVATVEGDFTSTMKTSLGTAVAASAVASVTGNVGGSVASVASGGITAASFAADAITAAKLAADVTTELQSGLATAASLSTAQTAITAIKAKTDNLPASPAATGDIISAAVIADAVWDEVQSGHVTASTFGAYLDASVSGVSTGGVSAADIADAVLDEVLSGHTTAGSLGKAISDIDTAVDANGTLLAAADADIEAIKAVTDLLPDAGALTSLATASALDAVDNFVDTEVSAIKAQTDKLTFNASNQVAVNLKRVNDVTLTGDGSVTAWGPV